MSKTSNLGLHLYEPEEVFRITNDENGEFNYSLNHNMEIIDEALTSKNSIYVKNFYNNDGYSDDAIEEAVKECFGYEEWTNENDEIEFKYNYANFPKQLVFLPGLYKLKSKSTALHFENISNLKIVINKGVNIQSQDWIELDTNTNPKLETQILNFKNCSNIEICGGGTISGLFDYWGENSKKALEERMHTRFSEDDSLVNCIGLNIDSCENINIHDLTFKELFGRGIKIGCIDLNSDEINSKIPWGAYMTNYGHDIKVKTGIFFSPLSSNGYAEKPSRNIKIYNLDISEVGAEGLMLTGCIGGIIKNVNFRNLGSKVSYGIDIEGSVYFGEDGPTPIITPEQIQGETIISSYNPPLPSCSNILIEDCYIFNNLETNAKTVSVTIGKASQDIIIKNVISQDAPFFQHGFNINKEDNQLTLEANPSFQYKTINKPNPDNPEKNISIAKYFNCKSLFPKWDIDMDRARNIIFDGCSGPQIVAKNDTIVKNCRFDSIVIGAGAADTAVLAEKFFQTQTGNIGSIIPFTLIPSNENITNENYIKTKFVNKPITSENDDIETTLETWNDLIKNEKEFEIGEIGGIMYIDKNETVEYCIQLAEKEKNPFKIKFGFNDDKVPYIQLTPKDTTVSLKHKDSEYKNCKIIKLLRQKGTWNCVITDNEKETSLTGGTITIYNENDEEIGKLQAEQNLSQNFKDNKVALIYASKEDELDIGYNKEKTSSLTTPRLDIAIFNLHENMKIPYQISYNNIPTQIINTNFLSTPNNTATIRAEQEAHNNESVKFEKCNFSTKTMNFLNIASGGRFKEIYFDNCNFILNNTSLFSPGTLYTSMKFNNCHFKTTYRGGGLSNAGVILGYQYLDIINSFFDLSSITSLDKELDIALIRLQRADSNINLYKNKILTPPNAFRTYTLEENGQIEYIRTPISINTELIKFNNYTFSPGTPYNYMPENKEENTLMYNDTIRETLEKDIEDPLFKALFNKLNEDKIEENKFTTNYCKFIAIKKSDNDDATYKNLIYIPYPSTFLKIYKIIETTENNYEVEELFSYEDMESEEIYDTNGLKRKVFNITSENNLFGDDGKQSLYFAFKDNVPDEFKGDLTIINNEAPFIRTALSSIPEIDQGSDVENSRLILINNNLFYPNE